MDTSGYFYTKKATLTDENLRVPNTACYSNLWKAIKATIRICANEVKGPGIPPNQRAIDVIAKRNLTLAGVTLAALSIMIGFYKENLYGPGPIIPSLFTAMAVFFLGSQFGYDAENVWEASLADVCQYVGTILLLLSFSIFLSQHYLSGVITLLIVGFAVFVAIVYLARIVITITNHENYSRRKRSGQED